MKSLRFAKPWALALVVLASFFFTAPAVDAQITEAKIRWVATLPGTCRAAVAKEAIVYKYTSSATQPSGLYTCKLDNQWELQAAGRNAVPSVGLVPQSAFAGTIANYDFTNQAASQRLLYTAPANTKALVFGITLANPTAGAIGYLPQIVYAGPSTKRINNAASSVSANSATGLGMAYVLEPGESASITPAGAGLSLFGSVLVLPATSGWKSPTLNTFVNGDNLIYQVPGGKIAYVLGIANNGVPTINTVGNLQYTNDSGGSSTVRVAFVPNGETLDWAIHALNGVGTATATGSQLRVDRIPPILSAGDRIYVASTTATAGQWAAMTVYETAP